MSDTTDVPRTDLCEECETEIVSQVVDWSGRDEIIHEARKAEEGFMPATGGEVEVLFRCDCSQMTATFGPGSVSAWDVPDEWMWEGEVVVDAE
jgi:hypothetical protein